MRPVRAGPARPRPAVRGRRRARRAPPTAARRRRPSRLVAGGCADRRPRSRAPSAHDGAGVRGRVLGDQVGGALVAVHVRRAAAGRAGRAGSGRRRPGRAGPTAAAPGTSAGRRRPSAIRVAASRRLGWSGSSGMSATKSPTACRRAGGPVRRARTRRAPPRAARGRDSARWPGRTPACARRRPAQQRRACGPAGSATGAGGAGRLVHRGVGEHDAASWSRWASAQPSEIGAAPVVGDGHDRAGRRRSASVDGAEVVDPLRRAPRRADALGAAHAELVDRDHPPAGAAPRRAAGATGRTRSGCRGRTAACRRGSACRAPLSSTCQVRPYAVGVGRRRRSRDQRRVEPGQARPAAGRAGRRIGRPVTRRSR